MPGTQETTLNAAGLKLGALIAGGELSRGVVLQSLIAAGNQMVTGVGERPWTPEEIRAKVHRAVTDGGATPRQAPPREVRHTIRVEIVPPEAPPRDEAPDYWAAEPEPEIPDQNPTGAHLRAGAPLGLLPIIDFDDVAPNLNTADFVEGLLIEGAMSVVYGPSNCGKTFFATDLGLHVAAGWEWRGRAVEQGAVAYCALEGSHGISNRVAAFKAHHGVVGGVPFFIIPVSINLLDPAADRDRLVETVKAKAAEKGVTFRLIVIDTLSRAMAGGNENAPDDMGALVSNADYVRQALPAHTMFIHHSGKDQAQGARGHSLLRAATDTEIEISRENTEAPSVARVTKQRELEIDGEFVFKLEPVELGINQRGKPVTSCIVATVDGPAPTRKPRLSSAAEAGLTALREALAKAGQTGQHRDIPRDIPAVPLENWRFEFHARSPAETPEARKKAFQRAQRDLLETKVAVVLHGMAWIVEGALHD
jgi:RecA-family ATPase